jgi:hypothetical protein
VEHATEKLLPKIARAAQAPPPHLRMLPATDQRPVLKLVKRSLETRRRTQKVS